MFLGNNLKIIGQFKPNFGTLICRWIGVAGTTVSAIYPNEAPERPPYTGHDELAIYVNPDIAKLIEEYGQSHGYGKPTIPGLFHPWTYVKPFLKDYEGKPASRFDKNELLKSWKIAPYKYEYIKLQES